MQGRRRDILMTIKALIEVVMVVAAIVAIVCLIQSLGLAEVNDFDELDPVFVMCYPDSYVTIRSSPKKAHNEEAIGCAGDVFWTDWKEKNGFLHIYGYFEAGEGWVKKCYVSIWEPYIYPDGKAFTVRVKQVNCRKWMDGPRKGWLKRGAEVKVWLEGEEWCVTNYGYIQTKYLEEMPDEAI